MAALTLATACKKPPCPASFKELAKGTDAVSCSCEGSASGSVWGSGIYTTDSSICAAAVHAGAVPEGGGVVSVAPAPGCEGYTGSKGKGSAPSASWGKYEASFFFPGHGDGKCPPVKTGPDAPCPGKLNEVPNAAKLGHDGAFSCTCAADSATSPLWGSGVYTTDSAICGAARHAGAIGPAGCVVSIKTTQGCASYVGTTANGVPSAKWGAFDASFYFPGHGDGACKLDGTCPGAFNAIPAGAAAAGFSCTCPAGMPSGNVWGSGAYTADSAVCAAAVHAGAIGPGGGMVSTKSTQGCPAYVGTLANGVTSAAWGQYATSFFFAGHGDGSCPK